MGNHCPDNFRGKSPDVMSSEHLQELLQAELDSDREIDVEKLKAILAAIDARTEQETVDVDAAWDRFLHNHLPSEPITSVPEETSVRKQSARKKHLIRAGLAAALIAVFCLGAGVTASAAGFNFLDAVMQWSSETFGFSYDQNNDTSSFRQNPEYAELKAALADAGVTEALIPNYLPEGYKQQEFYQADGRYAAVFQNEDDIITIRMQAIQNQDHAQMEKDQPAPEVYTVYGVDHYITTNMDAYVAAWTNNGYSCFISGVQNKAELLQMIDSIYMEGSE